MPESRYAALDSLARTWRTDEVSIRQAAKRAGIMLFTWHGRTHAEKDDLKRLGEALHRQDSVV